MNAVDILEVALGAIVLLLSIYDVFQSVVLPRPAVGRVHVSASIVLRAWPLWKAVAGRAHRLQMREAILAAFGPLMVVVLLGIWAWTFIVAYALMYNGLHQGLSPQPGSFGESLFFSSGKFLSFAVGAFQAHGTATPVLTSLEAANGFGLFALVISLLFSLFTAFQRRENAVVALDALAGAPPSGVQILENCAKYGLADELVTTFDTWRAWSVDVLESHLAYPLLFFFRSSHDNEAWSNSFGAVIDAAGLVLSTIDGGPSGHARLVYKVGSHFVTDVRYYFRSRVQPVPGIEREEFSEAYRRLGAAGYRLHPEDTAWSEFIALRATYAAWLNDLARRLDLPPAPWIGDRSYLPHRDGRPAMPHAHPAAATPQATPVATAAGSGDRRH